MELTFASFKEAIESLYNFSEYQKKLFELSRSYGKVSFLAAYKVEDNIMETTIIKLLKNAMNDDGNWIDYWIYDLKFGKEWTPMVVTERFGDELSDIKLKTVEDLWTFLLENKEKPERDIFKLPFV